MKHVVEGDLVTKADLRAEIQSLRADIYRQFWVMGSGIVGVTVALLKLIP